MSELALEPYAVQQQWEMATPLPGRAWEELLAAYLAALAHACAAAGPCVIGHVKALVLFPGGGYLRVSAVSPHHPPTVDGCVPDGLRTLSLTLNLMVYGLTPATLQRIAREEAAALAAQRAGQVTADDAGEQGAMHHHQLGEHPHPGAGGYPAAHPMKEGFGNGERARDGNGRAGRGQGAEPGSGGAGAGCGCRPTPRRLP